MRAAVIGIGSNSLRLLVADYQNGQLHAIFRGREGLRVFASLDSNGRITNAMIEQACGSVNMFKTQALAHGAEKIMLFATSAVRDAGNQQEFASALLAATGLTLDICSGELEAKLSFIGAAQGQRAGMIDIGGGSTEIAIGENDEIAFSASLQAGAVRLFRDYPVHTVQDVRQVEQAVNRLLVPLLPQIRQCKTPTVWVGVGGTMTAAAAILQNIGWNAGTGIHGYPAGRTGVWEAMEQLASLSPDQRRMLRSVPPDRADILVHGLAILHACMETLTIDTIVVSERTNLDGYLKLFTAGE